MRSYLYIPGDQSSKLARAFDWDADAIVIDLEDGVAPAAKPAARALVATWLGELGSRPPAEVWVRINAPEGVHGALREELEAVVGPAVAGLVVPKSEQRAALIRLDEALGEVERRRGVPPGSTRVVPLVETAVGLCDLSQLATAPRVERLQLGEVDLAADLGIESSPGAPELAPARWQIVLASVAAGLGAPVAPVSTELADLAGFRASTLALRRLGFLGRSVIHPSQVIVANEVFTPTPEEAARARQVLERFAEEVAAGRGVYLDDEGHMVDEAVVRSARQVLVAASAASSRTRGGSR